jgi:hypothetical protein
VRHRTLVAFVAAVALGCVPVATSALAAPHGHGGGGHATAGHARGGHVAGRYGGGYRSGPIYDSCQGYGYGYNNGCAGNGLVGGVINGVLGGYGRY